MSRLKVLPDEYTDLVLLLGRLPFCYEGAEIEVRTYDDEDFILVCGGKGEHITFCDGSPLSISGCRVVGNTMTIEDDGLWDVRITLAMEQEQAGVQGRSQKSFLKYLEYTCEEYGYTLLDLNEDMIVLERMDRVVLNGYSVDGSEEVCRDADIDFVMVCQEAIKKCRSTFDVLGKKLLLKDLDKLYNEELEEEQEAGEQDCCKQAENTGRSSIFYEDNGN